MKTLTRFEVNLNHILRCVLGRFPLAEALPLMVRQQKRPKCLSRACVDLMMDTLAKGVTARLAKQGWQQRRFFAVDRKIEGRLWQRHSPESLGLTFSRNTLKTLVWLTSENAATSTATKFADVKTLTMGDRLFNLLLFECVRETIVAHNLLRKPTIRDNALLWLMYPDSLAEYYDGTPNCTADLDCWLQPDKTWLLETLEDRLCLHIQRVEAKKHRIKDHSLMQRLGEIQSRTLTRYLDAAESAGRRDLTLVLLRAVSRVVRDSDRENGWLAQLDVDTLRMADRTRVYRAGLALFHSIEQLSGWQQESLNVGFYDENYESTQFWKAEWEALGGDQTCADSAELIRSVDPLA